jgi:predicted nucleic acid-binding protein
MATAWQVSGDYPVMRARGMEAALAFDDDFAAERFRLHER